MRKDTKELETRAGFGLLPKQSALGRVVRTPARLARAIPSPSGAGSKTGVCTAAIFLISLAAANVAYGIQGGNLTASQAWWTLAGVGLGSFLVWLGSCHTHLGEGS